ncbi:MAG: GGDEF domain-containing protein [Rhodobacteraceae bacterium]|nr:GGDEF domain-containing protein [Paracoccaceae bacterium]
MKGSERPEPARLGEVALGRLMPMHVRVGPRGHIRGAGPTMLKLCRGGELIGARFLDVFELHPLGTTAMIADIGALAGQRLQLVHRASGKALRGHVVPLEGGLGALVNLSFGIQAAAAVRDHDLTNADFAPTDLTVELLYVTEAKAAVMAELAALNRRLQVAREAAEAQALTDALTGLANRRAFDAALGRATDAASRGGADFALLHLDLDLFKSVNDTLGHAAGDFVLSHVAQVLRSVTRRGDIAARVGGDEFVVLMPGLTDAAAVEETGERIIAGIEAPLFFEGKRVRVSGSVGATLSLLYERPDADRMLSDADTALYTSKHEGRGRVTLHAGGHALRAAV